MPEHQDTTAVGSGQDEGEMAAGGVATCQRDAPQGLLGSWAVGASASMWRHTSGKHRGDGQAEEVRDIRRPCGHHLWEVPSTAAGGALHREVNNEFHGDRESQLCTSPTGCEVPA